MTTDNTQYAENVCEMRDLLMDVSHSWRLACNGGGWEQIERALKEVVKWEEDQQ